MIEQSRKYLSIQDTNVLKGLALLLLLWHHLFYKTNGLFEDFTLFGYGIANQLGIFSKVCVAIFVFLSGYGLIRSNKSKSVIIFYRKRFVKLFANYWFIWLIFVPLNIFCFGYSLEQVYNTQIVPKLIIDFVGMASLVGTRTMNATWWFYSCIIILYALFPIIYRGGYRYLLCLLIALILPFVPSFKLIEPIRYYLLPFVMGIICGDNRIGFHQSSIKLLNKISLIFRGYSTNFDICILFVFFLLTALLRNISQYSLLVDSFLALLIYLLYINLNLSTKLKRALAFLGKHSFNIFLFHTFFYYYWFKNLFYSPTNPILIFLLLLLVTLLVSLVLEYVKEKIGFNKVVSKLLNI